MGKFFSVALVAFVFCACSQHYEEGAHPPPKPAPKTQLPAGHPPAQKASGVVVSGTIRLADGLDSGFGDDAVLFIIARPAPVGGPPLAVKRLSMPKFPFEYTLEEGDAMMGQGFDWSEIDALYLSAKIDADGQIGGSAEVDVEGIYQNNPVVPGASNVDIVIDKAQ